MEKKRTVITAVIFLLLIFGIFIWKLCAPDQEVSRAERRKLAQAPRLSAHAVLDGSFGTALEDYLLDQFPLREKFRTLNAALRVYVFRQQESDGIRIENGIALKRDDTLSEKQISLTARKITEVCQSYFPNHRVFYAVIPEKNAFADEKRPHMDYDRLRQLLRQGVQGAQEIDLWDLLSLEDYYRTDLHWRQDRIYPVAQRLAERLGIADRLTPENAYEKRTLFPFYGAYYGQAALPLAPDELVYLESAQTKAAVVTGLEFEGERPVYTTELFEGMDGYDVYLSGAQALLSIEVPNASSERELIVFRDSFSSALVPYLIGAYSKITLVDLRYFPANRLEEYVELRDQDVLFLYSVSLVNRGGLLK